MRFSTTLFILFHSCISSLSAPTSTTAESSMPSSSMSSSHTVFNSSTSRSLAILHPHSPTHHPSGKSPGRGPGRFTPLPTRTRTRTMAIAPTSTEAGQRHDHRQSPQKPIIIFFEALGGLVGLVILISCIRCCYSYNRTPKRDRIAAVLHRHQLERELEELERNPFTLRRSPTNDPVPPYFPPPPTYEVIASTSSASSPLQRSNYAEVPTVSPPSSPSSSSLPLESASPQSPVRQPPVPSTPNG